MRRVFTEYLFLRCIIPQHRHLLMCSSEIIATKLAPLLTAHIITLEGDNLEFSGMSRKVSPPFLQIFSPLAGGGLGITNYAEYLPTLRAKVLRQCASFLSKIQWFPQDVLQAATQQGLEEVDSNDPFHSSLSAPERLGVNYSSGKFLWTTPSTCGN